MSRSRRPVTALALIALLVLVPLSASAQARPSGGAGSVAGAASIAQIADATRTLEQIQLSFREIAKKVLPVVVKIDVVEVIRQSPGSPPGPFRFFFGTPPGGEGDNGRRVQGLGSGIIVRRAGNTIYVLTNNHVVESATEVTVKLNDQRAFSAKVVGKDARRDIALVSFESRDPVAVAELGDSSELQVGDLVMAVGNPFGFESTLTMGIVSALGRSAPPGQQTYTDYIQTDAAINEGNSGGALVNSRGQVVGISTWIAGPANLMGGSAGSVGLGFAIPINNARRAIDDFITKGKVEYGWLGVQIGDVQDATTYPGFAKDMKLEGLDGAFVLNTYKGSPADRAGLLPGDYVVRADGADIRNSDQLTQTVGGMVAGRSYSFEIVRYGERQRFSVKIASRDDRDEVAQYKNLWPGMTVIKITPDIRKEAGIGAGVDGVVIGYIPDQDTPAAIAGFRPGDVITGINGRPVRTIMDFYRGINDRSKKDVTFTINRKNVEVTIGLVR